MMKQLSVYAENQKGAMYHITALLAREEINILGSVNNEGTEYGIVRMVVSDTEKAEKTLTEAGYLCRIIDVIGVEVEDEVGSLKNVLQALYESNINVNYIYLTFNRDSGKPVLIFHTHDIAEVEECIAAKGFKVV
jgi:hypothetical protein